MGIFEIIAKYSSAFLHGIYVTLQLCLITWGIGLVFGVMLGALGKRFPRSIGVPFRIGSFVLSGLPILVFLFWLHYPLQAALNVVIDPFFTAAVALTIVNVFAVADLVRNSLINFPAQYVIAAQVCGLSSYQTLISVQSPIILRQILPSLLLVQVSMLQMTLFASLISVDEIFRIAQQINAIIYKPIEIYTALAIFFLIVCLPLNGLAMILKKRFTRDISER